MYKHNNLNIYRVSQKFGFYLEMFFTNQLHNKTQQVNIALTVQHIEKHVSVVLPACDCTLILGIHMPKQKKTANNFASKTRHRPIQYNIVNITDTERK